MAGSASRAPRRSCGLRRIRTCATSCPEESPMPRTRSIAWSQLKLGILGVIAAALAVVIIVAVGGQGGFFWQRYPLKAQFTDAQGLRTGAVVRLAGKDVGQGTAVGFAGPVIEVQFEVSKKVRSLITEQSMASVGSTSLLGESILDLKAARAGAPLADWGYVPTEEAGTPGDIASGAGRGLRQGGGP